MSDNANVSEVTADVDEFDILFAWMPAEAREVFRTAWVEDEETAWQVVRNDPRYETWFPGNRTDDGRVRIPEADYARTIVEYEDVFRSIGINPDWFKGRFGDLIRGEVTPDELARDRIQPMYDRIVSQSTAIRQYYAETYGMGDMTAEAFMAGVLDPELGSQILAGQISVAEIGGEALESGFSITEGFAQQLLEAGMGRQAADRVFTQAETALPTLSILAQRHADPDDDFNLEEFTSAMVFSDPAQLRRIRRLRSQEESLFTNATTDVMYKRTDPGGVSGLAQQ